MGGQATDTDAVKLAINLLPAAIPLTIWGLSALTKAITAFLEFDSAQWRRLYELAGTIDNRGDEYGLWRQIIAVRELSRNRWRRGEALAIIRDAQRHWHRAGVPDTLWEAIEDAAVRLAGKRTNPAAERP